MLAEKLVRKPLPLASGLQIRTSPEPDPTAGAIETDLQIILADVDTWRGRAIVVCPEAPGKIDPLHRGMDSRRWTVSLDGAAPGFFLKIIHAEQAPFINIAASFAAQQQAAALGCTPAVAYTDSARRIIVTDYLDSWTTGRVDDLRKPAIMEKVLKLKTTIHRGSPFRETTTVFEMVRKFRAELARVGEQGSDMLAPLIRAVLRAEEAITAAGWDARPAHADGLASNIMIGPGGEVQLVDFDQACNVDPFYEIGILLNEAFQLESEMLPALEMVEGQVRRSTVARCRIYAIADDLVWGMWGLLMNATSARRQAEFLKYAYWRLLRCRFAIEHSDFEKKLRGL